MSSIIFPIIHSIPNKISVLSRYTGLSQCTSKNAHLHTVSLLTFPKRLFNKCLLSTYACPNGATAVSEPNFLHSLSLQPQDTKIPLLHSNNNNKQPTTTVYGLQFPIIASLSASHQLLHLKLTTNS